ncbi:calcium-binding protein [Inquilinus sp. YAF38]|uniref:calcium-binding protein n=1 Tax=Inquilinus sp. YAF38 TaxID=3233084 RepID=UPI003F92D2B2
MIAMIINGTASIDDLWGSMGADVIAGLDGGDHIYGQAGDDRIDGGGGKDYLTGENGSDTIFGGSETDHLVGASGDDHLDGGAGQDYIEGGVGADVMDGGDSSTLNYLSYRNSLAGVTIDLATHAASGGEATGDRFVNFQNIDGSAYGDTLTGNSSTNMLYGGAGNDTLSSGADYDYLYGQDGNDVMRGGPGATYAGDTFDGGNGIDAVTYTDSNVGVTVNLATGKGSGGDAANDVYTSVENVNGSAGHDNLVGNGGANVLDGWAGADVLTGGGGADRFNFTSVQHTPVVQADTISDFSHAEGDNVVLSAIDANMGVAGNQAFTFIGSALYSHHAGELRYADRGGGHVTIAGDVNGDGASDFHIELYGASHLTASDFSL